MNGTTLLLSSLYGGEIGLADALLAAAARHKDEAEIRHVATDLAHWSRDHAARLATAVRERGLGELAPPSPALAYAPIPTSADAEESTGDHPGLLLLGDLLRLNAGANANAAYWDMLTGLAKATKDTDLLEVANLCSPQTQRQAAWTRSMLKTTSPQVLTAMDR